MCVNPFPNATIKLENFADDNFKFDENGKKFSKWVENTVEEVEIARYECFQKTCTADIKTNLVWERDIIMRKKTYYHSTGLSVSQSQNNNPLPDDKF